LIEPADARMSELGCVALDKEERRAKEPERLNPNTMMKDRNITHEG